ncbi:hypothetical protein A3A79_01890 [Candidatus Gottesmanbacteria bacterium RIFCSPLOWO2_01_FULL_43_11b]|uniref:NAD-dependent epimerase/dehydratase domain-containing protein n=1 Tax=Candidatus Gottesmanbacteria bacterium RIFCSPLOWO2_01_FULL_43_11b TaxID=1798392 RepID=A0A1F6AHJ7_9BACT|nr:MAG: hypothetical protein A3A79_01890 [Candidatus Gottesmanbacteria bacterium RIFCSPLOWO2_01_FULL_43_11b]
MKLSGRKILITGGAGFIGSHLSETLAKNNRVVVYDNFSSSVISSKDIPGVRFIRGDILDEKKLIRAMRGVDVVFHLAVACVRLSLSEVQHVHEVNSTGTLTTLLSATKSHVKRFIYISSSEVYGGTDKSKISENHPIKPTTVYGISKYQGELYTKLLPSIIIRPFNAYGPRSHFEGVYGEVIPRFVIRTLAGLPPIIFGDGKQTRDFTYVSDTVSGIIKAAQSDKLLGSVINIAYGREISIRRTASIISPLKPIHRAARPLDVHRLAADIRLAKKMIGYKPRIAIDEGLARYISWVKKTVPNPKKLLSKIPDTNW